MAHSPIRALAALLIASFVSHSAIAQEAMGLVTGPKTGTYYIIGKELAETAGKAGIPIEAKISEGSIDNIKRISGNERAPLGIVQSDVLSFLSRSENPDSQRMAANLRLVFPLYDEEVHVISRRHIKSIADLHGKKVAIGEDGSGNMLTAINLFAMMDVTPAELHKIPSAKSVVAVLKGELDAAVVVAGKPVRLFKNLEDLALPENKKYKPLLDKLHFVPLDNPKMLEEYKPAKLTSADYNFIGKDVKTVAVQAVMISYDFSQGNRKRCDWLGQLGEVLRKELPALREKGHPKWQQMDLDADAGVWRRDTCAWPELVPPPPQEEEANPLGKDLIDVIEKRKPKAKN